MSGLVSFCVQAMSRVTKCIASVLIPVLALALLKCGFEDGQ